MIISDFLLVRECDGSHNVLSRDNSRFRFLVTVSSKGTTNGCTHKRQYNYSQHVHEL